MGRSENNTKKYLRIAKKAQQRAADWIRNAEVALEENRWNDVVYSAQMAAEQSMKSILLALGVTYKRVHDISIPFRLLLNKEVISETFRQKIPQFAENLVQLTHERHLAGYGFEEDLDEDHFKEYAPQSLLKGREIHNVCVEELTRIEKVFFDK
ncbi:MAG: HEPN domain-containing protein [Candidatus Heimdallarchaeota archaeon]|nr:MAG: HEPN domain-containing protein [Candidatus Heimdallarchaeota archaeon]